MTGPAMVNILTAVPATKPSVLNSRAGAATELAKPVIGTSVPAPACLADKYERDRDGRRGVFAGKTDGLPAFEKSLPERAYHAARDKGLRAVFYDGGRGREPLYEFCIFFVSELLHFQHLAFSISRNGLIPRGALQKFFQMPRMTLFRPEIARTEPYRRRYERKNTENHISALNN